VIGQLLAADEERKSYGVRGRRLGESFSWIETARRELAEISALR
jgi:hypothetical protein